MRFTSRAAPQKSENKRVIVKNQIDEDLEASGAGGVSGVRVRPDSIVQKLRKLSANKNRDQVSGIRRRLPA
jgi:hypothetical protein